MDPAAEVDTGDWTFSRYIEYSDPSALLALFVGLAILILGIRLARRRGPRHLALVLFAASWTALLPALTAGTADAPRTFVRITLAWSMPGAAAIAQVVGSARVDDFPTLLDASIGLFLGLVGSTAALARSRTGVVRPAVVVTA